MFKRSLFMIVVKYAQHEMCHSNHFEVCNLVKYNHIPMQTSPLSICRTFHLPKLKLSPLNTNSSSPLSPAPGNHDSTSCLYAFDYSRYLLAVD